LWCPRFHRPNPSPVEPREQRLELRVAQRHQAVPHCRPGEAVLLQPLVGHNETGAIPVEQLQPIRLLGAEHKDRAGERVLVQRVLHQRRQAVMTFAEVDRLGRHHDPQPVRGEDHAVAASARTTDAIRLAEAPGSSRMITDPTMISGLADPAAVTSSTGATINVANSTGSSGGGSTSFPFLASVRHEETWLAFNPCRCATSRTVAPGLSVSSTILAFTSSGHCRLRRPRPPLVRSSNGASMEKLPLTSSHAGSHGRRTDGRCGEDTAYGRPCGRRSGSECRGAQLSRGSGLTA